MDKGNSNKTTNANCQFANPATQQAFITTNDNTPEITAFLIFLGEFSLYALYNGRKIRIPNAIKNGAKTKTLSVYFTVINVIDAITIAYNCTTGHERVAHVVLAIAFTFPYVLLMLLFNKCSTKTLANL